MANNSILTCNVLPSDDWELNILLLKVAQALEEDDFHKLKFLCTGRKGIPTGILEKLNTPEKFFNYLRQSKMISRDNLLLLQAFLWHVDRKDLHNMAADYARRVGDVLYFYAPDPKPENGFTHLRFHVSGTSLGRFQRSELEALRSQVSRLLFVPPEFVFLSGVEPAQSITLTFMVHRNIEAPLPDLLKDHGGSFSSLGVDRVWFEDQEVRLTESLPIFMESKVEQKLCDLFNRNQKLEEQIVEQEVTLIEKQEELQSARVESARWQQRENYFRSLLVRAVGEERPDHATSRPVPVSQDCDQHIIV